MSEQEWGEEVDMLNVVCPDCAFSYCHIHTDADGGYSCPLCAEAAITAERDTLRERVTKLEDGLLQITRETSENFVGRIALNALNREE